MEILTDLAIMFHNLALVLGYGFLGLLGVGVVWLLVEIVEYWRTGAKGRDGR